MLPPHAVQNRISQKNKYMRTLVSILMTILGILSPALSSRAQEADRFPGEFKEIHSINDFTEGYYIICYQLGEHMAALCTPFKQANNKERGGIENISGESSISSHRITDPKKNTVWKVERTSDGKFTLQNEQNKVYITPTTEDNSLKGDQMGNKKEMFVLNVYPTGNGQERSFTLQTTISKSKKKEDLWLVFHTDNKVNTFVLTTLNSHGQAKRGAHSPRFFKLVVPETNQLTISSVKCATFYSEKAMKLPAGLTAHVGEVDAQHGVVHLKAIGSVVPANTAVIITGEPGTYTLTATTEAPQSFAKNDLKGTSTNITASEIAAAPEAYYALSINQGQPCFGILERDLPAGKAYFTQPKSAGTASQFLSDFIISSVQHVQQKAEEGPLYDLNGRAVTQPVKGNIYVRNGKKFIYLR